MYLLCYRPVYEPSLDTVESLSTIKSHPHEARVNQTVPPDVKQVYQELQEINSKLQVKILTCFYQTSFLVT